MKDCTCGWQAVAKQLASACREALEWCGFSRCDCCEDYEEEDCECACHPLKAAIEAYERKEKK